MIVPPPVASSLIFGAHRIVARRAHRAREQHIFRSTSANQGQVSPNVSRAKDVQRGEHRRRWRSVLLRCPRRATPQLQHQFGGSVRAQCRVGRPPAQNHSSLPGECRLRRWAPAPVTGCGQSTGDGRHLAPFLTYLQQESQIDNHAHRNGVVNTRVRRHNWCGDG